MLGALIIAFVLVVVIPVSVLMGGAVLSAALGWSVKSTVDADHAGSELLETNR